LITPAKAQEVLDLIERDCEDFERGGTILTILQIHESVGLTIPLDWIDTWFPEAEEAWTHFMTGQTFCEYGYYLRDVTRFLRSKAEK